MNTEPQTSRPSSAPVRKIGGRVWRRLGQWTSAVNSALKAPTDADAAREEAERDRRERVFHPPER